MMSSTNERITDREGEIEWILEEYSPRGTYSLSYLQSCSDEEFASVVEATRKQIEEENQLLSRIDQLQKAGWSYDKAALQALKESGR